MKNNLYLIYQGLRINFHFFCWHLWIVRQYNYTCSECKQTAIFWQTAEQMQMFVQAGADGLRMTGRRKFNCTRELSCPNKYHATSGLLCCSLWLLCCSLATNTTFTFSNIFKTLPNTLKKLIENTWSTLTELFERFIAPH